MASMGQIGIESSSPLSSLARGRMGGNVYLQYDCVIYVFILGLNDIGYYIWA